VRDFSVRAQREAPATVAVLGSLAVHGAAIGVILLAARGPSRVALLPTYRVELVAAPAEAGTATRAAPAERPAPAPAPAPPPSPAPAPAAPVRRPPPAPPPAAARPAGSPTRATPAAPPTPAPPGPTAAPGAAPGTGTDPASIRTEGVEFPFPGYLRNVVAQVYRRWRPPAGTTNLEAEVLFLVHRDGSISGLQFVRRSGSFAFDLEAQGAVEAAARAQAFGPLPEGYGPDVLPVSFFFSPRMAR